MDHKTGCWVAYTTVDSKAKANDLASCLVKEGWVACVNLIGPLESVYEWKGNVEQAQEWLLMMKCSQAQREGLKEALIKMHNYEVPELIFLEIADGHERYLNWIRQSGRVN